MKLRCKLLCTKIEGTETWRNVTLNAIYTEDPSDENKAFSAATPSATFQIMLSNPDALDAYQVGTYYYFDSIPVRVASPTPTNG